MVLWRTYLQPSLKEVPCKIKFPTNPTVIAILLPTGVPAM